MKKQKISRSSVDELDVVIWRFNQSIEDDYLTIQQMMFYIFSKITPSLISNKHWTYCVCFFSLGEVFLYFHQAWTPRHCHWLSWMVKITCEDTQQNKEQFRFIQYINNKAETCSRKNMKYHNASLNTISCNKYIICHLILLLNRITYHYYEKQYSPNYYSQEIHSSLIKSNFIPS